MLVLWDVDHTLVTVGDVSREIYARAFLDAVGFPLRNLPPMTGRTEHAIIRATLKLHDVDPTLSLLRDFYAALGSAARSLETRMTESGAALAGAMNAIEELRHERVVQSLVTGNIASVAQVKLRAFEFSGLDRSVGGYGDDGSERARLVQLARDRASEKHAVEFAPDHVVVIGDSPHDVKGATDSGAVPVGVARGASSADELRSCGAHLVLNDLTESAALRRLVLALLTSG